MVTEMVWFVSLIVLLPTWFGIVKAVIAFTDNGSLKVNGIKNPEELPLELVPRIFKVCVPYDGAGISDPFKPQLSDEYMSESK